VSPGCVWQSVCIIARHGSVGVRVCVQVCAMCGDVACRDASETSCAAFIAAHCVLFHRFCVFRPLRSDFAALMCCEHVSEHLFFSEILIYIAETEITGNMRGLSGSRWVVNAARKGVAR